MCLVNSKEKQTRSPGHTCNPLANQRNVSDCNILVRVVKNDRSGEKIVLNRGILLKTVVKDAKIEINGKK